MKDNNQEHKCCCNGEHHEHNHEHHHEHHHEHGEDCNCDEVGTIVLTLDDDSEIECMVLGIFDVEEQEYIALLPIDEADGDDVFIYQYNELEDEEIELNIIEDEEQFNVIAQEFQRLYDEED